MAHWHRPTPVAPSVPNGLFGWLEGHARLVAVAVLLCYVTVAGYSILYGGVNEDEGWYLYAARLVGRGQLPYIDFAYTQGPVHAYVYGVVSRLLDWSLYRGRIGTALLGVAALLLAMSTARRLGGGRAALVCGAALATNAYVVYYLTIPKTYALAACWCVGAVRALVSQAPLERRAPLAALLLACATGTRISFAPTLAVLFGSFWLQGPAARRALWRSVAVAAAAGGMLFLPYLLVDPHSTVYNLVGYHMARYSPQDGWAAAISTKAMVLRVLSIHCGFLLAATGLGFLLERRQRARSADNTTLLTLHVMAGAVFLAHLLSGSSFAEYQVALAPLLAILAGVAITRAAEMTGRSRIVAALTISAIVVQARYTAGFPWRTSAGRRAVDDISELAREVSRVLPADMQLLTQHTYLAMESRRDVPAGFELSSFAYYPQWSTEVCQRHRAVNDELVLATLTNRRTGAVFIMDLDFGLDAYAHPRSKPQQAAIRTRITQVLESDFTLVRSVSGFGQFRDSGQLWLRRGL